MIGHGWSPFSHQFIPELTQWAILCSNISNRFVFKPEFFGSSANLEVRCKICAINRSSVEGSPGSDLGDIWSRKLAPSLRC
jgi:hypothetical protein